MIKGTEDITFTKKNTAHKHPHIHKININIIK